MAFRETIPSAVRSGSEEKSIGLGVKRSRRGHVARFAFLLLVLTLLVAACGGTGSGGEGVMVGNTALDFSLKSLDGGTVSLSDYRGSVVLVNFWATWCPPCRAEIPDLEAAYQAHKADGLVVLGVDVEDKAEQIEAFAESVGMTYPVLLDESGATYRAYRAPGLPMTLVVDREGIIQVRHAGYLAAETLDGYLDQVMAP